MFIYFYSGNRFCSRLADLLINIIMFLTNSDAAPSAVASFSDGECEADGVCPNDPLLFTCEVNETQVLRVTLPDSTIQTLTPGVEFMPIDGITLVSLNTSVVVDVTRNYVLTLSSANASVLAGGNITCDNTGDTIVATAGCPALGMFSGIGTHS